RPEALSRGKSILLGKENQHGSTRPGVPRWIPSPIGIWAQRTRADKKGPGPARIPRLFPDRKPSTGRAGDTVLGRHGPAACAAQPAADTLHAQGGVSSIGIRNPPR